MNEISLKLDGRTVTGKQVSGLRRDGVIPSVVYGGKKAASLTQSENVETTKVVKAAGRHTPVYLTVDGKKKLAIIKTIDVDPVKSTLRHVAFHTIKQNETIETEVPVVMVGEGESEAEKAGLVILQTLEEITIKALPKNLPESLEADIRGLKEPGEKLLLGDITLPEGVELVEKSTGREEDNEDEWKITDSVVASVWEPSALQAANDAAAGDADEETEVDADNGEDDAAAETTTEQDKAE